MENKTMLNAEDLGFDAEDLKEAGLDKQEPATSAGNDPEKPEDNSADGQPKTEPNPGSEPEIGIISGRFESNSQLCAAGSRTSAQD